LIYTNIAGDKGIYDFLVYVTLETFLKINL